jgi:hypothetical protein
LQHPFGHVAALQTHAPDWQTCPALHAAELPHWQTPVDEQLSESVAEQPTQVAPSVPQFVVDGVSHVLPLQQPVEQDVELQTHDPPEHT